MRLLTILLIFELILAPLNPLVLKAEAQSTSCPTGYVYNSTVNRCVLTQDAMNQATSRDECMDLTGDARANCLTNRANSQDLQNTAAYKNERTKNGWFSGNANRISVATFASVVGVKSAIEYRAKNPQCKNLSFYGIAGGGVAMMGAEVLSIFSYNKRIKEAKAEFDKLKLDAAGVDTTNSDTASSGAVDLQVAAFDVMIKKEEAIKAAAKTKQTAYNVAFGAYTVAAANAAMEIIQWKVAINSLRVKINSIIPNQTDPASTACKVAGGPLQGFIQQSELSNVTGAKALSSLKSIDSVAKVGSDVKGQVDTWTTTKASGEATSKTCMTSAQGAAVTAAWQKVKTLRDKIFCESKTQRALNTVQIKKLNLEQILLLALQEIWIHDAYAEEIDDQLKTTGDLKSSWGMYTQGLLGAAGGAAVASSSGAMDKGFTTPHGRFVVSGAFGTYAKIMADHAKKQQDLADERIGILEDLKLQVEGPGNALTCTGSDRTDTSNPRCYCYNPDNTRNESRNNSEVCAKEWGKAPSLYGKQKRKTYAGASGQMGCVNQRQQFDPQCKCRNTGGKNTCLKSMAGIGMGFPMTASMTNTSAAAMDALNNGQYDSAMLSGLEPQIGAFRKKADAILTAMKDPQTEKSLKDAEKALVASLGNVGAGVPMNSSSDGGDFSPGMTPKQALEEIKKDLKKASDEVNAAPVNPYLGGGAADDNFKLDMNESAGGVEEVMAQNFDYGSNDINADKGSNIFDILSLRYKRSALRRLFNGEGESTPDEASGSDINP
jgi:hypothetical protein